MRAPPKAAALDFFGLAGEEVLCKSFWKIFPETRTMPVADAVRRAMELGVSGIQQYVSPLGGAGSRLDYPLGSGVSNYVTSNTCARPARISPTTPPGNNPATSTKPTQIHVC